MSSETMSAMSASSPAATSQFHSSPGCHDCGFGCRFGYLTQDDKGLLSVRRFGAAQWMSEGGCLRLSIDRGFQGGIVKVVYVGRELQVPDARRYKP